ncbi:MAG: MaoC family dehydratase [Polyangia bacterium]|jgi:acyl dehydratase|nr:MaoC family dehydratase [Polyangia bacterium]
MSRLRLQAAQGLAEGDRFSTTRRFTAEEVSAFAAITRDYNPIHFEEGFARARGFEGAVCHGLLVAGLLTELGGQLAWLASGMSFRFLAPVYPGDAISCELVLESLDEDGRARASASMTNQRGEPVLRAELFGRLPAAPERALLKDMLDRGDPTNLLETGE